MNISNVAQSILYNTTSASGISQSTATASSSYEELQSAEELIAQDDTDSDGQLTVDETPLTDDMFSTADEDGDGYLTADELEAYLESGPGASGSAQALSEMDAASILESEDADESGTLTIEETTLTEEMFATADSDGDGSISAEELEDYISAEPGAADVQIQTATMDAASIIEDEDEDDDGALSIDETTLTEEMFATADSDGDGSISAEELEDYLASAPEGTSGTGGPPPGGMPPEEDDDDDEDLSVGETTLAEEIFATADSDGDGSISVEELTEYLSSASDSNTDTGNLATGGTPSEADTTSISAANAFAINAYENVSSNFMSAMTGNFSTHTDSFLSGLVV